MHRQVGDLLVRHLVMPEGLDQGRAILDWLADRISPQTFVNIRGQCRPCFRAADFPKIDGLPDAEEILKLKAHAQRLGLRLAE